MLVLWPTPGGEVDPAVAYAHDSRPEPAGRPWVMINMIGSVDGGATDPAGRSGGLGGPADKQVFVAIRAVPDVIVAGAATVASEDYGPPRLSPALRAARRERGQAELPRLAVVTASLRIDPDRRLFREADPGSRPLILTTAGADAGRRRALEAVADVIAVGDGRVDWRRAMGALRSAVGARVVLCEGGPSTNAQLVVEDLVDELCLTLAPALVGGAAPRIVRGAAAGHLVPLGLERVLTADGYLFLRYVRPTD
jgi:riboflavin biosynthesis pyrimidine reductase